MIAHPEEYLVFVRQHIRFVLNYLEAAVAYEFMLVKI